MEVRAKLWLVIRWIREESNRAEAIRWCLCAALLSELAVTPRLWTATRAYPTVPLIEGLPTLSPWATLVFAWALVGSLLAIAVLPRGKWGYATFFACAAMLVVADINRLQPWFYQYLLMFGAYALSKERIRPLAGFVVAGFYFWSGVQKANLTFATDVFPWLMEPLGPNLVAGIKPFWWVFPVVEASLALALTFPRTRRLGIGLAVTMNCVTLALLGPFGHNYNQSVWPWNFWLGVLAVVVFGGFKEPLWSPLKSSGPWQKVVAASLGVVVGILPALDFAGTWDGFLSCSYYSGRLQDAWIYVSRNPWPEPKPYVEQISPTFYRIDVSTWAYTELNAPPYAEVRVYKVVARSLEQSDAALLVRDGAPPWRAATSVSQFPAD